jgi:NTP-dependent ternary system trypsin peptidase co-occuring protein
MIGRSAWVGSRWGVSVADFVEFELPDGALVLFETADSDLVRHHGADAKPTEGGALGEKLTGAAETAEAVSKALRERLSPDELTLELGLKVSGQANWFVAKAQSEGTIKVTLKWRNNTPPPAGPAGPGSGSG